MLEEKPLLVLLPGLDGTGLLFERFLAVLPSNLSAHIVVFPKEILLSIQEYVEIISRQIPLGRIILLAESLSENFN